MHLLQTKQLDIFLEDQHPYKLSFITAARLYWHILKYQMLLNKQ